MTTVATSVMGEDIKFLIYQKHGVFANRFRLTWSVHGIRFLFWKITKSASFDFAFMGSLQSIWWSVFFLCTLVCRILLIVLRLRLCRRYVRPNRFHAHATDYAQCFDRQHWIDMPSVVPADFNYMFFIRNIPWT